MKRSSIRFRITVLAAVSVALVLVLVSVGLVAIHRRQLTANLDLALTQRAQDLTVLLTSADLASVQLAATQQEGFAQVLSREGEILASSPNLAGGPPLQVAYQANDPETISTVTGLAIDDDVFRVLSRTVPAAGGPVILQVGTTLDDVIESADALIGTLFVAIPLAVVLMAGVVWWLVGRTLKPVESIRSEVAEIGATDLHRRVPLPAAHDEIGRLAETMNVMLERLEKSVDRQQRFVGDASHELRSPLARLRAEIEVDLATLAGADATRLESLRDEVIALQRLVEDLLVLARLDADHRPVRIQPIDLDDLVFKVGRRVKADGRVDVDMSGVSGAHVAGDPHQLERAITNLSDNAERHASHEVKFTLMEEDGRAVLTIGDDGPGIPEEHADRIFERFVRVDAARSQATGGSGLGLAITREIIERHGGTVELDTAHTYGARFVVTLPLV
jgi:signal transduction histidine kinase